MSDTILGKTIMTSSGVTVEESKSEEPDLESIRSSVQPAPGASARPRRGSAVRSSAATVRTSGARPSMQKENNFRRSVTAHVPRKLRRWPRTCACCLGVLIPLNVLVVVSLVSGLLLGKLEMQSEIDSNDAYMRQKIANDKLESDLDRVLHKLPTICLSLFHQDESPDNLPKIFETIMTNQAHLEPYLQPLDIDTELVEESEADTVNITNTTNTTNMTYTTTSAAMEIQQQQQKQQVMIPNNKTIQEMSEFFAACTQAGGALRDKWLEIFQPLVNEDDASLSFNFIRCVNQSSPLAFNVIFFPDKQDIHAALPSTQSKLFEDSWRQDQQELEEEYMDEGYSELQALTKSYQEATGNEYCAVNMPSAAWFWFTVMTTVGYGNQVPVTFWGRLLTYTVGFLSILLFGGVLATAGGITTHLLHDFMHRFKRKVPKLVKVLVWGTLWCLWMMVIAYQAMSFQQIRLKDDLARDDAYWLAFMSTTTVGFGDFYLQPEGLFINDLLGLWITYLIGFVFLSSFLTELSQLLGAVLPDLVEKLEQELKYAYDCNQIPEEVLRSGRRQRNSLIANNQHDEERPTISHPVLMRKNTKERNQPKSKSDEPARAVVQVAKPTIYRDIEAGAVDSQEVEGTQKQPRADQQKRGQKQQPQQQQKQQPKEQSKQQQSIQPQQKPKPQKPQQQLKQPTPPASTIPQQKKPQSTAASAIPKQKMATFVNAGKDPSMAKAELYYKNTRWGPLGHQDPPISVSTYPGDQWYIVANGVYAKLFTVGDGAQQKFTI